MEAEKAWGQKIQGRGGGEGRRGWFHVHCSGRDSEVKGERGKEKNAGERAGSGEDGQWGLGVLPSEGRERRRRGDECR